MTWAERLDSYARLSGFPQALFQMENGGVVGVWVLGQDYRVKSKYYGGFPATYLRRIKALFPDKWDVLHLFSGRVDTVEMPGDTVDINGDLNPTYVDDAQTLLNVPLKRYDLIMCDPPYSVEDAEHYQTTMVSRNKVMRALSRVSSGTHVVWLDQVIPLYRRDTWDVEARIGVQRSTNHRVRIVTVFRRR